MSQPVPRNSGALLDDDPTTLSRNAANQPFRELIPKPTHPKIEGVDADDAHAWLQRKLKIPPVAWLIGQFNKANVPKPFKGITHDGNVIPDLYRPVTDDALAAPTADMVKAAEGVLAVLSDEEKKRVCHDIDSDEYRIWRCVILFSVPCTC
jgi:hypothetical protein